MDNRKVYRAKKVTLPPELRERRDKAIAEVEADRERITLEARAHKATEDQWRHIFADLRAERLRQGVSLDELEAITGIGKGTLSRLENSADSNPTISTLRRVATALGSRIDVVLLSAGKSPQQELKTSGASSLLTKAKHVKLEQRPAGSKANHKTTAKRRTSR